MVRLRKTKKVEKPKVEPKPEPKAEPKVEPKAEPKEYGYVVCFEHGGYQHKDTGIKLPCGKVVKVERKYINWLKGVNNVKEVEL